MSLSYGFIETKGLVGAIEAADAMVKAAKVRLINTKKIGAGFVTVIIEGELGACQAAVDAGKAAVERTGQLVSAHVIPNPFEDTEQLVSDGLFRKKEQRKNKIKPENPARVEDKTGDKPKKSKPVKKSPDTRVIEMLKAKENGLTLDEIASKLKMTSNETRIILKKLMDEGSIEKVRQSYYPALDGDRT
ncbi:MAG: BMC domain-containing protein [Calditrichaceae bacterium]